MKPGHGYRMSGSTPTGRSKSYPYYVTLAKPNGLQRHVRCEVVDDQLPDLIRGICVDPELIPRIREIYQEHFEKLHGPSTEQRISEMKALIARMRKEETAFARLYAQGKLTDEAYDEVYNEWRAKLFQAEQEMSQLQRGNKEVVDDLELALNLMQHAHRLYERMDRKQQARLLQILFARIIIDTQGTIQNVELNPPFMYLYHLKEDAGKPANSRRNKGGSSSFQKAPPHKNAPTNGCVFALGLCAKIRVCIRLLRDTDEHH